MKKKVIVLGEGDYKRLFTDKGWKVVDLLDDEPDLVCFTGGTDINPAIYHHNKHYSTDFSDFPRDKMEQGLFEQCIIRDIPMVGICRGSQLLCALSGGALYQDVGQHCVPHQANTVDGESMMVTSSHHQMMNPVNTEHKVLMSVANRSSYYFEAAEVEPPKVDYEVVYFPKTRALSHQPHPEWMAPEARYPTYFWETVDELLAGTL